MYRLAVSAFILATLIAAAAAKPPGSTAKLGAQTNWEFTRWGMTQAEIIAAARGRLSQVDNPTPPYTDMNATCPIQIAPYEFNHFQFKEAKFCFSKATGELVGVDLGLNDPHQFIALDRAIRASLGQPVMENNGSISDRQFNDPEKGNMILLMNLGYVAVSLTYRPLAKGF